MSKLRAADLTEGAWVEVDGGRPQQVRTLSFATDPETAEQTVTVYLDGAGPREVPTDTLFTLTDPTIAERGEAHADHARAYAHQAADEARTNARTAWTVFRHRGEA